MEGSVSGAAAASPEGQEQIADAVQQTTGFSPASEPAEAPHPTLREDQIQNAVAFLAHPKVRRRSICHSARHALVHCSGAMRAEPNGQDV